jgi:hypothetical protein
VREPVQPLRGKRRRVTDEDIYVFQTWMTFAQLARKRGFSYNYARDIRSGLVKHKNPSP